MRIDNTVYPPTQRRSPHTRLAYVIAIASLHSPPHWPPSDTRKQFGHRRTTWNIEEKRKRVIAELDHTIISEGHQVSSSSLINNCVPKSQQTCLAHFETPSTCRSTISTKVHRSPIAIEVRNGTGLHLCVEPLRIAPEPDQMSFPHHSASLSMCDGARTTWFMVMVTRERCEAQ